MLVGHTASVGIDAQLEMFKSAAPHLGNHYTPHVEARKWGGCALEGLQDLEFLLVSAFHRTTLQKRVFQVTFPSFQAAATIFLRSSLLSDSPRL